MCKMYGNKRKPNPIPETYDQDTELFLYSERKGGSAEYPIATGKWTTKGFLLKRWSLIVEDDKNEQYVKDIKKQLDEEDMLEYNEGLNDYSLKGDIYLQSVSTAGRLVQGHTSNGHVDWRNKDGVNLKNLS